jgi:hypothetical protein
VWRGRRGGWVKCLEAFRRRICRGREGLSLAWCVLRTRRERDMIMLKICRLHSDTDRRKMLGKPPSGVSGYLIEHGPCGESSCRVHAGTHSYDSSNPADHPLTSIGKRDTRAWIPSQKKTRGTAKHPNSTKHHSRNNHSTLKHGRGITSQYGGSVERVSQAGSGPCWQADSFSLPGPVGAVHR